MNYISHIERICAKLRLDAVAHNRPFLAHLLEMVVVESRAKPDLPVTELKAIATQMRENLRPNVTALIDGERWSSASHLDSRRSA